jgi:hypothetical protein
MDTACVKVRLKPDSLDRVRASAAELNRRSDEVLATLLDEQVVVESVFLDQTSEGDLLIYYLKARLLEEAGAGGAAVPARDRRLPSTVQAGCMGVTEAPRTADRLRELRPTAGLSFGEE